VKKPGQRNRGEGREKGSKTQIKRGKESEETRGGMKRASNASRKEAVKKGRTRRRKATGRGTNGNQWKDKRRGKQGGGAEVNEEKKRQRQQQKNHKKRRKGF